MKHSFIIKSIEANVCKKLTFETVLDFKSEDLRKSLQLFTHYKVLDYNPKVKTFSEIKLVSFEQAIKYLQSMRFYYEEPVIKSREKLVPIVSFHGLYCPFEVSIGMWYGVTNTFFEEVPYSPIRDYKMSFVEMLEELFPEYEVKVAKSGAPYIRENLRITVKNNIVTVNKVTEESYTDIITKVAEY